MISTVMPATDDWLEMETDHIWSKMKFPSSNDNYILVSGCGVMMELILAVRVKIWLYIL